MKRLWHSLFGHPAERWSFTAYTGQVYPPLETASGGTITALYSLPCTCGKRVATVTSRQVLL